jgi:hypothetical protein
MAQLREACAEINRRRLRRDGLRLVFDVLDDDAGS